MFCTAYSVIQNPFKCGFLVYLKFDCQIAKQRRLSPGLLWLRGHRRSGHCRHRQQHLGSLWQEWPPGLQWGQTQIHTHGLHGKTWVSSCEHCSYCQIHKVTKPNLFIFLFIFILTCIYFYFFNLFFFFLKQECFQTFLPHLKYLRLQVIPSWPKLVFNFWM